MEIEMPHKVFAIAQATEPVTFELEGRNFHCRPRMAAGVILAISEKLSSSDEEKNGADDSIKVIRKFFKTALIAEDLEIFNKLLDDPDVAVPMSVLTDILSWLSEVYTARPTGETSGSTSQGTSVGSSSTVGASPEVLTSSPLMPAVASV